MAQPTSLNPTEAAAHLGVHEQTIRRWAREGKLRGRLTPGGHWRFSEADLDACMTSPEPETAA